MLAGSQQDESTKGHTDQVCRHLCSFKKSGLKYVSVNMVLRKLEIFLTIRKEHYGQGAKTFI